MKNEFGRERTAYAALNKFLDDAIEVARLFELAGVEVPAPVVRVLGMENGSGPSIGRIQRPPAVDVADRPDVWKPDWFWIEGEQCTLNTLVLALLCEAGTSLTPQALIQKIAVIQPEKVTGSIYNVGPRLQKAGKITRTDNGWHLMNKANIPILQNGKLWGPKRSFEKQDVAAYRRRTIIETLASEPDGLMIVQLTKKLAADDRCNTPINKDLVKVDMQVLEAEGLVKRGGGHSKKWRLLEKKPVTN